MTKDEEKFCGGLTGLGWLDLLIRKPQEEKFCDKYNGWALMTGENWLKLLKESPKFRAKAEKYVNGIAALIALYPNTADSFTPWEEFGGWEWQVILAHALNLLKSAIKQMDGGILRTKIGKNY